jgi:putative flippase GtrA
MPVVPSDARADVFCCLKAKNTGRRTRKLNAVVQGRLGKMHDFVVRHWRRYSTANGKKMFRYTMVSVVSTVFGFTVLGIVFGALHLWTEVPTAIFANVVGIVPMYYLNRSWVWEKTGPSHWRREVLPFWAVSVAGILLSVAAAEVARHISIAHHFSHTEATALLLAVTFAVFGFLWVFKFLVFSRLFRVAPPKATDPNLTRSPDSDAAPARKLPPEVELEDGPRDPPAPRLEHRQEAHPASLA